MLLLVLSAASVPVRGFADETHKYVSPDRKLQALVIPAGKAGDWRTENRVEIRDVRGKSLLTKSFVSKDGEHGYIVYRADWTPDSQFFVFSVYSSGGHSPWNSPTYFYCRSDNRLRLLDDYIGPVTDPDFELSASNVIRTSKLKPSGNFESVAVEAKLNELVKQKPKR
jgi:hypothetical protein